MRCNSRCAERSAGMVDDTSNAASGSKCDALIGFGFRIESYTKRGPFLGRYILAPLLMCLPMQAHGALPCRSGTAS